MVMTPEDVARRELREAHEELTRSKARYKLAVERWTVLTARRQVGASRAVLDEGAGAERVDVKK